MQLLELALDLAARAGDAILDVRRAGFDTHHKADESPVTAADHAAEALIAAGLRAATPHIPVIAEEEIAAGHLPDHADMAWIVDPLDGTREFAAGRDEFAVCIGLVRHNRPVLGAVGAPAYGAVYGGLIGAGAWKIENRVRRKIACRTPPITGIAVVTSRHYADDPRLAPFLANRTVATVLNIGSALKFCRVAEGLADLYPRFGRTMEWDTAAPQALVEAAGGSVRVMDSGAPLAYGKPRWENPAFVCAGP